MRALHDFIFYWWYHRAATQFLDVLEPSPFLIVNILSIARNTVRVKCGLPMLFKRFRAKWGVRAAELLIFETND